MRSSELVKFDRQHGSAAKTAVVGAYVRDGESGSRIGVRKDGGGWGSARTAGSTPWRVIKVRRPGRAVLIQSNKDNIP